MQHFWTAAQVAGRDDRARALISGRAETDDVALVDAARLLVFAIAIATHAPLAAGVGGCVAGTTSIVAGWLVHGWFASRDLVIARRFCGAFVLLAGAWMGLALTGGY